MMDRDKILQRFGWNVLYALDAWKRRGYELTEKYGSLILTADKTEIRIERWSTHIYVKMIAPMKMDVGIWSHLINMAGDCPSSKQVVMIANEYLALAERERYRLTPAQRATFSREWRQLFSDLEDIGYTVEWRNQVYIKGHGAHMVLFTHRGKWCIASARLDENGKETQVEIKNVASCTVAQLYVTARLWLLMGSQIAYEHGSHGGGAA